MSREFYKTFLTKGVSKEALNKELLYNLYKVPLKDKKESMPHQTNDVENAVQQMDLLYLPDDNGRKYAVVIVDLATKKTDAAPLEGKKPKDVLEGIEDIYNRGILKMPKIIEIDSGSEFMGAVKKYFEKHDVIVRVKKVARHRSQASVEYRNQVIGKAIHMSQTGQELLNKETNRKWVKLLPSIINQLNKHYSHKVEKIEGEPIIPSGKKASEIIPEGTKVRVILERPEDVATGKRLQGEFRKSDIRWVREPTKIKQILFQPNQPIMYLVEGQPHTAYTKNQLQIVPENERLPPRRL